jgi:hypothetical protein
LIQIKRASRIVRLLATAACRRSTKRNHGEGYEPVIQMGNPCGGRPELVESAHALDLSGAWATNADQCSQVFVRKGRSNQVGFTALSEQYGGGFIVEADRLRGKFASCKMKSRKEDGHIVNIIAGCATAIMLSNVQFSLKVPEPNRISRVFPGIMDMEISYYRCSI